MTNRLTRIIGDDDATDDIGRFASGNNLPARRTRIVIIEYLD